MKKYLYLFLLAAPFFLSSCVTVKDVRYNQPSESLVINEEGLVPYNIPVYRITRNDMFTLNIVTTPKGDAAQFYSNLHTSGANQAGGQITTSGGGGGNVTIYFNGLRVDSKGDIYVFGIGYFKVEGKTLEEVNEEIQQQVNHNFVEGKSEVRLNLDGITYYVIGDVETTQISGEKKVYKNTLNVFEAISMNGGLNRTIDRTNVEIHRKLPEGIKIARLDLTRQDVMNSPYFWVQNGDEIYLNTRAKNLNGFGQNPLQAVTTSVSLLTTVMSIYLIISRL